MELHVETSNIEQVKGTAEKVKENVERVIVGKSDVVELAIVAVLCEGHVLIEDVPGLGKTVLAKSLAKSLGCSFRRIQCTPDLLPSDITGTYIFNQKTAD
ncbi:MAG: AAA family ATPase, partial [Spirochaetales bacterium]|nr:AAA family ATPase [Spirochaetales bacterium]